MNRRDNDLQITLPPSSSVADYAGGDYRPLLHALQCLAADRNLAVYLVGGPVRDWLLGLPLKDLDFAVVGDAPALARVLAERVGGRAVVHQRFGTATVSLDNVRIDLVTARRESYPVPGALPQVKPASLHDDLARRDFSVNAMALPLGGSLESVLDPMSGREDLDKGLIRILHPASFRDDPTRLFRAVRYEQRLGFRLEAETERELAAALADKCLDTVSGDRLRHELERIFEEELPGKALARTVEVGILPALSPPLHRTDYIAQWAAARKELVAPAPASNLDWLAALAYPLSTGDAEEVIRRLNMPASWVRIMRDSVRIREAETWLGREGLLPSELSRRLDGIAAESLCVAAALTDSPAGARNIRCFLNELQNVGTALNGRDLLDLGVPAGPPVGAALSKLREARLDRRVNSEVEERQWVRDWVAGEYQSPAAL